jgi:hypothetical protein
MSKYLDFESTESSTKTDHWSVQNHKTHTELGIVKWAGTWRQYCYFPTINAMYSASCLKDIAEFCETETKNYRNRKRK